VNYTDQPLHSSSLCQT